MQTCIKRPTKQAKKRKIWWKRLFGTSKDLVVRIVKTELALQVARKMWETCWNLSNENPTSGTLTKLYCIFSHPLQYSLKKIIWFQKDGGFVACSLNYQSDVTLLDWGSFSSFGILLCRLFISCPSHSFIFLNQSSFS